MAGKGGRPKGTIKKKDDYDKTMPVNTAVNAEEETSEKEDIRDAIHEMLSGNMSNLKDWLTNIGETNPERALSIFKDFAEYVLPKQQRTDSKDDRTSPIVINFEPSSKANIKVEQKEIPIKNTQKFSLDDLLGK